MSECMRHTGDCREVLKTLPDESVQCCVTSPPYWGLRDYGHKDQIGLEPTPELYVQTMVEVFREVRRILRKDGTLWLNLGDTYAAARSYQVTDNKNPAVGPTNNVGRVKPPEGLKQKDLVGIPWLTAFALRADGWYLRQDIIWAKPNPMPESVTDRCTKSHEYIFLLSKSQDYFYNANAIKEPAEAVSIARAERADLRLKEGWAEAYHGTPPKGLKRGRTGKNAFRGQGHFREHESGPTNREGRDMAEVDANADGMRNKRSVWTVNSRPYKEAHFATYPPDLIKPCILAGTKPGDTVLDPFGGSGTTGAVALELGRSAILIELNPEYCALIGKRTNITPGFPNL